MPTLFKRSNCIYYYIKTDPTSKRRWMSTKQRSKQLAFSTILQTNAEQPATKSLLFLSLIQEFISYATSFYSPGTVDIYRKSLNNFLAFTGNVDIGTIGHRDIDGFTILRLKEVSAQTVSMGIVWQKSSSSENRSSN